MSTDGKIIREVRTRTAKAAVALSSLNNIWKTKNIGRKPKLNLIRSSVLSVPTYGSDSWCCTKALENTYNTFENKCLGKVLGMRWDEFKTNLHIKSHQKEKVGKL